jgi:hypothetical protein
MNVTESAFSIAARAFLAGVEYRSPRYESEKELIYRMRYAAYLREGALPPGAPEVFKDRYDEAPNLKTYGLHVGGQLASSIRFHIMGRQYQDAPAMMVFRDRLEPLLESGATILDPTRFVIEETAARLYPKLPLATVRIPWMACEHYGVDFVLATVRTEHQPFYKRYFGHKVLCEARPYPSLAKPISLMMLDYHQARPTVLARYPFLRSTEEERRAIFEDDGFALLLRSPAA